MRVGLGLYRARVGFAVNSKLIVKPGACNRPAGKCPAAMGSQIFATFGCWLVAAAADMLKEPWSGLLKKRTCGWWPSEGAGRAVIMDYSSVLHSA
jgi:hypothetical protein